MPRKKEYKNRETFTTTAERDAYEAVMEICRRENIPFNSIIQKALDDFLAKYNKGEYIRKAETEIPSLLSTKAEALKWAWQVGPDATRKVLANLPFIEKALREQMRALERDWVNVKGKQKLETLQEG